MRLIVDVMSGDSEALEAVKGALKAHRELGVDITLVGDEKTVTDALETLSVTPNDSVKVVHAASVVTMEDDYLVVIKSKKDSSMSVGLNLLKAGEGDAFISTGNTGALVAGASLIVRKAKGIKAAAIGAVIPLGAPMLLIDAGANVAPNAETMKQFALMGSIYMENMFGLKSPRVALINNGTEETKGNDLARETYGLLKECPDVNFIGNIEGRDVVNSVCDVLVADGYTGNIILKLVEGFGKFMSKTLKSMFKKNFKTIIGALFLKSEAKALKKSMDYTEYGGAPLLGISAPVIKAHGNSGEKGVFSACRQAKTFVETGIIDEIAALGAKMREEKRGTENE
ncbi:MAG: phosphate acyltransferase PlsX [Ruminococcaceae bacterium]|nr:phosphate acyltransferase PlsX [Oscillospiraceae bacterium]